NKYNGNTFLYYDVRFEDVTRPTFSKLGKIYVAKNGDIWVISIGGKLQKYDLGKESFQYVAVPQSVADIIQNSALDFFIGTHNGGILRKNLQNNEWTQFLKGADSNKTVYSFYETNDNRILATTANGYFEISNNSYNFIKMDVQTNFSAIVQDKNNTLFLGSYGKGLFIKPEGEKQFKQFLG